MKILDLATNRHISISFAIIVAIYLVTRLIFLERLPIFVDEAIHIWWGMRFLEFDFLRSLNVGRPLEPMLIAPGLLLGIRPLLWARLIHVFAGFLTFLLLYWNTSVLFSKLTAIVAVILYTVLPYAVFHDRIALTEIYVALAMMLVLAGCLQIRRHETNLFWRWAVRLFLVFGFMATMPTGALLALLPVLFFGRSLPLKQQIPLYLPLALTLLAVIAIAGYRVSLNQSPGFGFGLALNQTNRAAGQLGQRLLTNITNLQAWWRIYLGIPFIILLPFSFLQNRTVRILGLFSIFCILFFSVAADVWYPRYLFFLTPLFCLAVANFLVETLGKRSEAIAILATLALCAISFSSSSKLITQPENSTLPTIDYQQYIAEWPSGYGVQEASLWLVENTDAPVIHQQIGSFMQMSLSADFSLNARLSQIHIQNGVAQSEAQQYERLDQLLDQHDALILVVPNTKAEWHQQLPYNMSLLATFPKPTEQNAIALFQLSR